MKSWKEKSDPASLGSYRRASVSARGRYRDRVQSAGRKNRSRADRKSTRLNPSHSQISYAVFCLKTKTRPSRRQSIAYVDIYKLHVLVQPRDILSVILLHDATRRVRARMLSRKYIQITLYHNIAF